MANRGRGMFFVGPVEFARQGSLFSDSDLEGKLCQAGLKPGKTARVVCRSVRADPHHAPAAPARGKCVPDSHCDTQMYLPLSRSRLDYLHRNERLRGQCRTCVPDALFAARARTVSGGLTSNARRVMVGRIRGTTSGVANFVSPSRPVPQQWPALVSTIRLNWPKFPVIVSDLHGNSLLDRPAS